MKFKVGDKVRLIKGSRFYGQFNGIGTIITVREEYAELPYKVRCGGYQNGYHDTDLELVPTVITNWKERLTK